MLIGIHVILSSYAIQHLSTAVHDSMAVMPPTSVFVSHSNDRQWGEMICLSQATLNYVCFVRKKLKLNIWKVFHLSLSILPLSPLVHEESLLESSPLALCSRFFLSRVQSPSSHWIWFLVQFNYTQFKSTSQQTSPHNKGPGAYNLLKWQAMRNEIWMLAVSHFHLWIKNKNGFPQCRLNLNLPT